MSEKVIKVSCPLGGEAYVTRFEEGWRTECAEGFFFAKSLERALAIAAQSLSRSYFGVLYAQVGRRKPVAIVFQSGRVYTRWRKYFMPPKSVEMLLDEPAPKKRRKQTLAEFLS